MGNNLTQQEQTLSDSLQEDYFFQSNQFLVHKATQRPCTLHRISTFSKQQSAAVERNIALYKDVRCNSISKLHEYFRLDNSGYCSDQQKFYLVFDGHNSPNIKEQYFSRRYTSQRFTHQQIEAILSCMLCGLRHYKQTFNRKQSRISLQSICINRNASNTLWLKDPWLVEKQNDISQMPINFLATYPSPEKIQASNIATMDYDQYKSDLFSIGIFGLQFLGMNFRDDLYVHKRFVDRQKVGQILNGIQNGKLRGGLGILLSQDPNERHKIYRYWDVQCSKPYRINNSLASLQLQNLQLSQSTPRTALISTPRQVPRQTPRQFYQPPPNYSPLKRIPQNYNNLKISQVGQQVNQHALNQQLVNTLPISTVGRPPQQQQQQSYQLNTWRPNTSTATVGQYSPQVMKPLTNSRPNLTQQFSKPLQMKSNMNITVKNQKSRVQYSDSMNSNFRKNNVVYFQQSPNRKQQQQQTWSAVKVKPQSQQKVNFTSNNSISNNLSTYNNKMYESNGKNQNVNKSFQTPRFNYPSPNKNASINYNTNSYNFNHLQNSAHRPSNLPSNPSSNPSSNPQSLLNSFNLFGNTSIPNQNNPYPRGSQPLSSNNSPIMTKSIISTQPLIPPSTLIQPKISAQESTQIFSNNQSMRQTKHISEGLDSGVSGSFPIIAQNNFKEVTTQKNYKQDMNNKSISNQIANVVLDNHKLSPPTNQPAKSYQQVAQIPILAQSSPQSRSPQSFTNVSMPNNNAYQNVTHPSQVTPPPVIKTHNKYNSTIVQVNQQTPNESSSSDNENNQAQIQFIVEEYETGSRYEGFKKNGLRHGRGKFYYQDGGYYDGQWKKNQMHGWGKLYYEGGQLAYQGNWAHDQFHGYGKVYNDNPVKLDTGFDYTNFDLLDDYWEFYQGMLANDTKQGRGRIQLTNKQVFEGDFHADRIQGFGKFLRRDNTIVQGIWRDSRLIKILSSNDIYK